jgi:hypothetical protein
VANIKKETHIVWYKDEREISVDEKHDFKDGICTLLITEVSGCKCEACQLCALNSPCPPPPLTETRYHICFMPRGFTIAYI